MREIDREPLTRGNLKLLKKTKEDVEKTIKVKMVSMPNFLNVEMPPRPRQEGFQPGHTIPVGDLTEAEANEYAEEMKQAFLDHWRIKFKHSP